MTNSEFFNGKISCLEVYNQALNHDEVAKRLLKGCASPKKTISDNFSTPLSEIKMTIDARPCETPCSDGAEPGTPGA